MNLSKSILAVGAAALLLSGCINQGDVADQHPFTFEQPKPAGGPTQGQAMRALQTWLVANVPDGSTAKDVSIGPIRYAALFFPFTEQDYFAFARFTAKNKFGTYTPPQDILFSMRVYNPADGWQVSLLKRPNDAAYRQYCIGQSHG